MKDILGFPSVLPKQITPRRLSWHESCEGRRALCQVMFYSWERNSASWCPLSLGNWGQVLRVPRGGTNTLSSCPCVHIDAKQAGAFQLQSQINSWIVRMLCDVGQNNSWIVRMLCGVGVRRV